MNWQDIVVYIIGAGVVIWLVWIIVRGYKARKYAKCSSCNDASCPYHSRQKQTKND